jgi:hypothetical protein
MAHATIRCVAAFTMNKDLNLSRVDRSDVKQEGTRKQVSRELHPTEWPLRYNAANAVVSARTKNQRAGVGTQEADDKGRKGGRRRACSGKDVPTCVNARLSFLEVPNEKKEDFVHLPKRYGLRAT